MNVRLVDLRAGGRADRANGCTFRDRRPSSHGDRSEVSQRDGVPIGGFDRHHETAPRHCAREADLAAGGRAHPGAEAPGDVDATVLAARVRIVSETEGTQHRAIRRPGPRLGGRGHEEHRRRHPQHHRHAPHRLSPRRVLKTANTQGSGTISRCQFRLQRGSVERVARQPPEGGDDVDGATARHPRGYELAHRGDGLCQLGPAI